MGGFLGLLFGGGLITLVIIVVVLMQAYRFWLASPSDDAAVYEVMIESGAGLEMISEQLADAGLVKNAFWFKVYGAVSGQASSIQAGAFELVEGMSYADVVAVLIDADSEEVQITIPEGYTLAQIGEVVVANFDVSQEEWGVMVGMDSPFEDSDFISTAQKPDRVDLEGYLFPDTYRFFVGATAEDIVGTLLAHMEENVQETGANAVRTMTLHEVLTLASIVQREVLNPDEMAMVADIFLKRLDIGMALQADSTVNYITGGNDPGVTYEDLQIDSLYNTYQYAGLPPGAISNPGFDAVNAVVHPISNEYYYFLTTPEGEVLYASTLEGHGVNRQYLD